jgi:hypothetical protein
MHHQKTAQSKVRETIQWMLIIENVQSFGSPHLPPVEIMFVGRL